MKIFIITYITLYLIQDVFSHTAADCVKNIKKDFSGKYISDPIALVQSELWYAQYAFLHMRIYQDNNSASSSSSTPPPKYGVTNCKSEDGSNYYKEISLYISAGESLQDVEKFCNADDFANVKKYFQAFIFSQEDEFFDKYTYNHELIQWAYKNLAYEDINKNDVAARSYTNHLSKNIRLKERYDNEVVVPVLEIPELYCGRIYGNEPVEQEIKVRERSPENIIH